MSSNTNKNVSFYLLLITILGFVLLFVHISVLVIGGGKSKTYDDPEVSPMVVRGEILDRNSKILAIQTVRYNLYFRLKEIPDINEAALFIAPYLGVTQADILDSTSAYTSIALIRRGLSQEEAEKLQEVIDASPYRGKIYLERYDGRTYPSTFHASQVIGFVNSENKGLEGAELSFDGTLLPYPGLGSEITYGDDVMLTLDLDIQYLVDVQVQEISETHHPDYIMAMVMGAKDGEVYAMSSYPWYDLNRYSSSSEDERMNRCLSYTYEPGSVFKIFTLAWCIEQGIDTSTPFICDGEETFTVDGKSFTITCHEEHGEVDAAGMIAKSCNGAIAYWVLQSDPEAFREYLTSLGFTKKYDVSLPGVTAGYLSPVSLWSHRSQATIAFGQEISVNALQTVTAATALANDGKLVTPSLVKAVQTHDGKVTYLSEKKEYQVMSAETAALVRSYMEEAVKRGTAKLAACEGVSVAAKTGTAQIINPVSKSYEDGTSLASTIALVPADDPKYIIYFAVSAPRGDSIWGANVAAPSCAAVINGLVNQGKIRSEKQTVVQLN